MERQQQKDAMSPSSLFRLREDFIKAAISPLGFEFEDFVEFVDKPPDKRPRVAQLIERNESDELLPSKP